MNEPSGSTASARTVDTGSLEELLTPLLRDAYGMAYSLADDRSDADDLVQEAALLALRHFETFEQGTNFKAWFYRILTNCFFAKCRKDKRRPRGESIDDLPDLYLHRQTAEIGLHRHNKDPAKTLMQKLDVAKITEALHALREEYRAVCGLYFVENLTYEEIAEILDCPVGTVRSRLHRGRKILQQELWSVAKDAGIVTELSHEAGLT